MLHKSQCSPQTGRGDYVCDAVLENINILYNYMFVGKWDFVIKAGLPRLEELLMQLDLKTK